ncbi:hypothetical protein BP6252_04462 [Coleophoma cylindrospora]|uniref:Aquaporin n=1 Tax=Coleophoma cylindrospora TaxID=1849047 RepID=A0A3D8S152_9HELO|nr:hypothetical protein BP6252_04462 [Coleophoma cylindrospora]
MLGEFIGTFIFLFFSFAGGQVANSKPAQLNAGCLLTSATPGSSVEQVLYIALGFGVSLATTVFIFFRVSGGMFNPAVTFGLCMAGAVPWVRGALLVPTQVLSGIVASFLASVIFPGPLTIAVSLGGGATVAQGLMVELFTTAFLVFTILMLAVEKSRATFMAPLVIGMALFLGHTTAINFTGAGINPARAFGPDVVLGSFPTYHWIYWLGPALGAIIAVVLHKVLKILEYETCNPGQDDDGRGVYHVVQKDIAQVMNGSKHSRTNTTASISSTVKPVS